jgi:hypothetical protein
MNAKSLGFDAQVIVGPVRLFPQGSAATVEMCQKLSTEDTRSRN